MKLQTPTEGKFRYKRKFAWRPVRFKGNAIWGETYYIKQEYETDIISLPDDDDTIFACFICLVIVAILGLLTTFFPLTMLAIVSFTLYNTFDILKHLLLYNGAWSRVLKEEEAFLTKEEYTELKSDEH